MDRDDARDMADALYGEYGEDHDWDDDCYDPHDYEEEYYEEPDEFYERRKFDYCMEQYRPDLKYFYDNRKDKDMIFDSIEMFENYFIEHCKSVITKERDINLFKTEMLSDKFINYTIAVKATEYHLQSKNHLQDFEGYYNKLKNNIRMEYFINKFISELNEVIELDEENLYKYSIDPKNAKKIIEVEMDLFNKLKTKWKVYYGEEYAQRMLGKIQDADFNDCVNIYRVIIELDKIRRGFFGATNFDTIY